jgi:methionyl-tRNA formyltransferase
MRIAFIGCVESSEHFLKALTAMESVEIVGVVTRERSEFNSDFADLTPMCNQLGIPVFYQRLNNENGVIRFLRDSRPDLLYCFGWSFLLPKSIFRIPSIASIGFHPAKLPQNRGRHPVIWALALGLTETASTFFELQEEADSGAIVSQVNVAISSQDNATTLYDKLMEIAVPQLTKLTQDFVENRVIFSAQDHSKANYWRKRSFKDGRIDFRMSADAIFNLVRALAPPYPGAFLVHKNQSFIVPLCRKSNDAFSNNLEPGRVISVEDTNILIKCYGDEAVWLCDIEGHKIQEGECL